MTDRTPEIPDTELPTTQAFGATTPVSPSWADMPRSETLADAIYNVAYTGRKMSEEPRQPEVVSLPDAAGEGHAAEGMVHAVVRQDRLVDLVLDATWYSEVSSAEAAVQIIDAVNAARDAYQSAALEALQTSTASLGTIFDGLTALSDDVRQAYTRDLDRIFERKPRNHE